MTIIKAEQIHFDSIIKFYYDLIESMRDAEFRPKWEKDVYPTRDFIQNSIKNGELYIGIIDGDIVGAMVINQENNDGYHAVKWNVQADNGEIAVLHILAVSPRRQRQGLAKKMVDYAINACKSNGIKALRLDVLISNVPAQKLYAEHGFAYIATVQLYYEDTGLMDFMLYELPLG